MALYLGRTLISGVVTEYSTTAFDTMDANATKADLLINKTAYVKGAKITGAMQNNGAVSSSLNCGASYTVPAGYHNGNGMITANSLASQTVADATPGEILTSRTAWVNGTKLTGTMPNNGAVSSALNCGASYTIPAGYHNGSGKITANSLASQTSATAAGGDILSGKTAWVNGSQITGSMPNQGAVSSALNCGGSYTIPAGYHNGSGKVTANSLASQTSGTAIAEDIERNKTAWVNGSQITGTAPVVTYATAAPSSGNATGDIWVKTTSNQYVYGNYSLSASGSTSYSITHWQNYATYTDPVSDSVTASFSGSINSSNVLTVSYNISHSYTGTTLYSDYESTSYGYDQYVLEYVAPNGTVTALASVTSTSNYINYPYMTTYTNTYTGSGSASVSSPGGYFRLTMKPLWYYYTAVSTTTTTQPSYVVNSGMVGSLNPQISSGVYVDNIYCYDSSLGWVDK